MPFIIRWVSLLVSATFVKALLQRVLVMLGISAVTYLGISAVMSVVTSSISGNLSHVSGFMLQFLSMCGIFKAMNVVLSAISGKLALNGLTGAGKISRIAWDAENSVVLHS